MSQFSVLSREEMMYHFFEIMRGDPQTEWVTGFKTSDAVSIAASFGADTLFLGKPDLGFASLMDVGNGVSVLHLYLLPHVRNNFRFAAEVLFNACQFLKQGGFRKVVVTLTVGNPSLRPNRDIKLGFRLAGILEKHVFVAGEYRDCCLYERFL